MRVSNLCRFLGAFLLSAAAMSAQSDDGILPRPPAVGEDRPEIPFEMPGTDREDDRDPQVLIEELRGLVIRPALAEERRDLPADASGIVYITELPLLNTLEFRRRARSYLGAPLTTESLDDLLREIIIYYRNHGRPVVDVFVPEQDVTNGHLVVEVLEARVGQVRVVGNRWFRRTIFTGKSRFQRGDRIHSLTLQEDLDWMNRNPFRRVEAVYAPGEEPGETDLVFDVEDRFPFRVYGGFENSGNRITGEERFLAGFNWGHAFAMDHELNYQFTTGRYLDRVHAHSASYVIPLPSRHELTLFGNYIESDVELDSNLELEGESFQLSGRYAIFLMGWERPSLGLNYAHEFTWGADFKRADNSLEFGDFNVYNTATEVIQGLGRYSGTLRDPFGQTGIHASLFYSPGNFISRRNRDRWFEEARAGAESGYYYTRLGLERKTRLPGRFSLRKSGLYQYADGRLLASEQLGVGGHASVRGYEERAAAGDDGYLLSAELRTPEFNFNEIARIGWAGRDRWQLLGFLDYGVAEIKDPGAGEHRRRHLLGAGPGMRVRVDDHFFLRFDYGWQIRDDAVDNDSRDHRAHAAVILSY